MRKKRVQSFVLIVVRKKETKVVGPLCTVHTYFFRRSQHVCAGNNARVRSIGERDDSPGASVLVKMGRLVANRNEFIDDERCGVAVDPLADGVATTVHLAGNTFAGAG